MWSCPESRESGSSVATAATLVAWSLLVLAAATTIEPASLERIGRHFVLWDIPDTMDWWVLGSTLAWWVLGSTLAWVGAGPTLLWYMYWTKDAGWGWPTTSAPFTAGWGSR